MITPSETEFLSICKSQKLKKQVNCSEEKKYGSYITFTSTTILKGKKKNKIKRNILRKFGSHSDIEHQVLSPGKNHF